MAAGTTAKINSAIKYKVVQWISLKIVLAINLKCAYPEATVVFQAP